MWPRPEGKTDGAVPFLDAFLLEDHKRMGVFVGLVERWARELVRKARLIRR